MKNKNKDLVEIIFVLGGITSSVFGFLGNQWHIASLPEDLFYLGL
jgi:hypothetical protein